MSDAVAIMTGAMAAPAPAAAWRCHEVSPITKDVLSLDRSSPASAPARYTRQDFIIADAKDGDMGPSITWPGPKREHGRQLDALPHPRRVPGPDPGDRRAGHRRHHAGLGLEPRAAARDGRLQRSAVKPAIRANDTTDIWVVRGGTYASSLAAVPHGSLPRVTTARRPDAGARSRHRPRPLLDHLHQRSRRRLRSLEAFSEFRDDAAAERLQVFPRGLQSQRRHPASIAEPLPHYINDCILRCLAGVTKADRPQFLKIAYNGPKALEELASFDPSLIVGVLGGGAGTTRDCFELLRQAERYGARVALFGRKINLAESPLDHGRDDAPGRRRHDLAAGGGRAYHGELQKQHLKPLRALQDDLAITETVLQR